MATRKSKALPKRIYVKLETDQNSPDTYLLADESMDGMEHGDTVGVYELKETRTKHVTHELK